MSSVPHTRLQLSCHDYTVGWICTLEHEYNVARILLDELHETPPTPGDLNTYLVGRMGKHNIVVAKAIKAGNTYAAKVVTSMLHTFPKIRFGLMVGIGGGATDAPSLNPQKPTTDIFLGDIVVSKPTHEHGGVLQYDKGKQVSGAFRILSQLNNPGTLLISAANQVDQDYLFGGGGIVRYIHEAQSKFRDLGMDYFSRPDRQTDLLFAPGYNHAGTDNCRDCDRAELVVRRSAPPDDPVVHRGLIASGNSLVRDARMRDTMRHTHGVLCFDMESAGVMNSLPCLAIRGIANYADSHKNDLWQPYAALTAGAYAKDLLRVIQPQAIEKTEIALDKYALSYLSQGAAGGTRGLEYKPSDCAGIYGSRARVVQ